MDMSWPMALPFAVARIRLSLVQATRRTSHDIRQGLNLRREILDWIRSSYSKSNAAPCKRTVTDQWRPYVLRLDRARPPNILATQEGGCVLVQPAWFRRHPA